jgi:uncharacterized membrane protein YraQ (UPF0718 family)
VLLLLAASLAARLWGASEIGEVETFVVIFVSIAVEAMPFILLGALVSATIAVYVPARLFERVGRLPVAVQVPSAALGGLFFPVCECGSVPVARRLILRGVHPAAGITFMLASPVINPIVLASTWVAYSGRGSSLEMVAGRAGLGLVVAVLVGFAVGRLRPGQLLRGRAQTGHDHDHDSLGRAERAGHLAQHVASDFLFMGKFIILGAAVAASIQTLVPQDLVNAVANIPLVAPVALMGLAFVLSLCSQADAFVAVSLTSFSPGSQLAFLVAGPMADTKLMLLYGGTFKPVFTFRLLVVTIPFLAVAALLFDEFV